MCVGVPEITPVDWLIDNPLGKPSQVKVTPLTDSPVSVLINPDISIVEVISLSKLALIGSNALSITNFVGLTVIANGLVQPSNCLPRTLAVNLILNSGLVGLLVRVPLITPVVSLISNPVFSFNPSHVKVTLLTGSPTSVLMCPERGRVGVIEVFTFPIMLPGIVPSLHSNFVGLLLEKLQLVVVSGRVVNNPPQEKLM